MKKGQKEGFFVRVRTDNIGISVFEFERDFRRGGNPKKISTDGRVAQKFGGPLFSLMFGRVFLRWIHCMTTKNKLAG